MDGWVHVQVEVEPTILAAFSRQVSASAGSCREGGANTRKSGEQLDTAQQGRDTINPCLSPRLYRGQLRGHAGAI